MKRAFVAIALAVAWSFAWALPTVQQVDAAIKQGNTLQAESMMKEVVDAKPDSARGHYVYAELLARNGNVAKAVDEAAKARALDPSLSFADPERFRSFEQTLRSAGTSPPAARASAAGPAVPARVAEPAASRGIPGWVWIAGLAVLAIVLWRGFARSRAASAPQAAMAAQPAGSMSGSVAGAPAYGGGYGGTVAGGAPMGRTGSGALGTGMAVAGGVVGGMLLGEALHRGLGGERGSGVADGAGVAGASGAEAGSFGLSSPGDGNAFSDRPIDLGTGGDDWGAGGADVDLGGGGDDGGW